MSRRQQARRMNPAAIDPFEHNRLVQRRLRLRRAIRDSTRIIRFLTNYVPGVQLQPWQRTYLRQLLIHDFLKNGTR